MDCRYLWAVVFAVTGCTPPDYHRCEKPNRVSLTIRGNDWQPMGDNLLHIRVYDTRDDWVEQSDAVELKNNGSLEIEYQCGLDQGVSYGVATYINTNNTGGCQRADDAWVYDLGDTSNDVLLEVSPKDNTDSAACEQF